MTTEPSQLRAAAEAQIERLKGPLWAPPEGSDAGDWLAGIDERRSAVEACSEAAPRRRATPTPRVGRRPGHPSFETPRLPAREMRIPVVVDDRTREVAAWEGIEPTDAIWMLVTTGWETWRRAHGAPVEIPA